MANRGPSPQGSATKDLAAGHHVSLSLLSYHLLQFTPNPGLEDLPSRDLTQELQARVQGSWGLPEVVILCIKASGAEVSPSNPFPPLSATPSL